MPTKPEATSGSGEREYGRLKIQAARADLAEKRKRAFQAALARLPAPYPGQSGSGEPRQSQKNLSLASPVVGMQPTSELQSTPANSIFILGVLRNLMLEEVTLKLKSCERLFSSVTLTGTVSFYDYFQH